MAETIYDGPPSAGDLERSLVEVAAQRDQLDQQVEALLSEVDVHRAGVERLVADDPGLKVSEGDLRLYAAADQVRKERGT